MNPLVSVIVTTRNNHDTQIDFAPQTLRLE